MRLWLRIFITLASTVLLAGAGAAQTGIVALGDSNTAGFGVAHHEAFPAQLEGMLRAAGDNVRVFNAGVAGDTFAAMLARLDHYVPAGTQVTIVQGGYNDVQRRSDSGSIAASIQAIVSRLRARGVKVLLCGFFYPDWDALGAELARAYGAVFVSGGACYDSANRGPDGLHMTAAGHQVVATRLFPLVRRMLAPAAAHASARREAPNGPKPTRHTTLKRSSPSRASIRSGEGRASRRSLPAR